MKQLKKKHPIHISNHPTMVLNRRWLLFLFLLVSESAISQSLSLDSVLHRVEVNNPQLASYQYRINSANTLADGAKAWSPPMVGIGFDQTPYSVSSEETFFNRTEGSAVIFAEQDFPNPAKQNAKKDYLSSLALSENSEFTFTKNQLLTEAKTAYIERFIAEKRVHIANNEIALLDLVIQSATNEYSTETGDLTSIYKARARKHSLEAMRDHENSAIMEATVTLNYLMNISSSSAYSIDTFIPFKKYQLTDLDTSSLFIMTHRSEIQKLNSEVTSLKLNNALILSEAKPDFGIRYEHYDMFGSRNTFSLMGSVSIPIAPWSAKSYKSQSLSTQQQLEAMDFEKQNLILKSRAEMQASLLHRINGCFNQFTAIIG